MELSMKKHVKMHFIKSGVFFAVIQCFLLNIIHYKCYPVFYIKPIHGKTYLKRTGYSALIFTGSTGGM